MALAPEFQPDINDWTTNLLRITLKKKAGDSVRTGERMLYALIVGIDQYAAAKPLNGCVNDAVAIKEFLEARVGGNNGISTRLLLNEEATRANIVKGFEEHLTQAREGDTALFYFAGHGSKEPAPEELWNFGTDRTNDTLVCYDSRTEGVFDFADKELLTLLDAIAQKNPHILVITDAGSADSDITRDPFSSSNINQNINFSQTADFGFSQETEGERQIRGEEPAFYQRTIDTYIVPPPVQFSKAGPPEILMPVPRYISIAAGHPFEQVAETFLDGKPRGVFTYTLLEILQPAQPGMTYEALHKRIRSLMTQRVSNQAPQFSFSSTDEHELSIFGGILERDDTSLSLYFEDGNWYINRGILHGFIGEGVQGERMRFYVYPGESLLEESRGKPLGEVIIEELEAVRSKVITAYELTLLPDNLYQLTLASLPVQPVKIAFTGEGGKGPDMLKKAMQGSSSAFYLEEVNEIRQADYILVGGEKEFRIRRPSDRADISVIPPISPADFRNAELTIGQINHIARWNQILNLVNPLSNLPTDAVWFEIFDGEGTLPIEPENGEYVFSYGNAEKGVGFRARITNKSDQAVYCTALYMSSTFEISTKLLPEGAMWIKPGEEVWLLNGKVITARIENTQLDEAREIFKLLFATEEFYPDGLDQREISQPKQATRGLNETNTNNLLFGSDRFFGDWNTFDVGVKVVREEDNPFEFSEGEVPE